MRRHPPASYPMCTRGNVAARSRPDQNRSLGTFVINGVGVNDVNGSDGLAVTNRLVGDYVQGLLVSHDEPESGTDVEDGTATRRASPTSTGVRWQKRCTEEQHRRRQRSPLPLNRWPCLHGEAGLRPGIDVSQACASQCVTLRSARSRRRPSLVVGLCRAQARGGCLHWFGDLLVCASTTCEPAEAPSVSVELALPAPIRNEQFGGVQVCIHDCAPPTPWWSRAVWIEGPKCRVPRVPQEHRQRSTTPVGVLISVSMLRGPSRTRPPCREQQTSNMCLPRSPGQAGTRHPESVMVV